MCFIIGVVASGDRRRIKLIEADVASVNVCRLYMVMR